MSDQQEAGVITSLEEIFLSREFGTASGEFDRVPVRSVSVAGRPEVMADAPELEQIFRSATFGKPQAVPRLRALPETTEPEPDRVPGTVSFVPRESTRYRAIAAVSGVAAAALVVAGVASGGGSGHPGGPDVSALGQRVSPGQGGSGSVLPPGSAPPPGAGTVGQAGGTGAASNATTVALTGRSGSARSVLVGVPTGATATATPSPAAASGGTGSSGGGGGTSPAPAPTTPGSPLASVINNTATTVGGAVTSAAGQLGNAAPALAPVTGVVGDVGSTVSGLGQSLALGPTVT